MAFDKLNSILGQVSRRYPALAKRLKEAQALGRWEAAVGPAIAKHSRAIRVKDQILWVEVDHPIWRTELHYRKNQILEALNRPAEGALGVRPAPGSPPPPAAAATIIDVMFIEGRGAGKPR